ncbi:glutamate--tRNA ligase family protein [uncultured Fibrobacter sp.]|uniref:glutamate--tRNA ligase family protein n=1 Tax=uncultured Fibrobacter sp. TaxID=261512 RepID=UPI002626E017|nr:glutamate--tRNA ligase family protein [uncultured Fibrobacter sp.]
MSGIIRFAPSPTGYLHEGHLLSALYVWAAAKKWDLKIHLRIEDHDQGRSRTEYIDSIREDLARFGFSYDSESIQSSRTEIYQEILDKLIQKGLVYPCTCSRKQLLAENPHSATGEVIYQGKCRNRLLPCNEAHSLRIKIPDKVIHWYDEHLGNFDENPKQQCGDFPIRDRDGYWTYQFAVCIDDLTQGITHIVRGEDILSSTARQIALSQLIAQACAGETSFPVPVYARPLYLHHPLIVDASGKKLSKREHAHSLRQDLELGISPEQIIGRTLHKAGFLSHSGSSTLAEALSLIASTL